MVASAMACLNSDPFPSGFNEMSYYMFGETDSTRTTFPLCFTLTGMSDIFPMGIQRPTKKRSGSVADAFY